MKSAFTQGPGPTCCGGSSVAALEASLIHPKTSAPLPDGLCTVAPKVCRCHSITPDVAYIATTLRQCLPVVLASCHLESGRTMRLLFPHLLHRLATFSARSGVCTRAAPCVCPTHIATYHWNQPTPASATNPTLLTTAHKKNNTNRCRQHRRISPIPVAA